MSTLSAMSAKSVSEDFSEPARIARAVSKEWSKMSVLEELPGCKFRIGIVRVKVNLGIRYGSIFQITWCRRERRNLERDYKFQ